MKRIMLSILMLSFLYSASLGAMGGGMPAKEAENPTQTTIMPKEKMSMSPTEEKQEVKTLSDEELEKELDRKFLEEYLFVAAASGDTAKIEELIKVDKISPNIREHESGLENTPLHVAKDLATVKLLIENGADINAQNKVGIARLHIDVFLGHFFILEYLFKNKDINVNVKTTNGVTPLHLAVQISYFSDPEEAMKVIQDNKGAPEALSVAKILVNLTANVATLAVLKSTLQFLGVPVREAIAYLKGKFVALPLWQSFYSPTYTKALKSVESAALNYNAAFTAAQETEGLAALAKVAAAKTAGTAGIAAEAAEGAAAAAAELTVAGEKLDNAMTAAASVAEKEGESAGFWATTSKAVPVVIAVLAAIVATDIIVRNLVVGTLLKHGADANALDANGNTPMHTLAAGPVLGLKTRQGGIIMAGQLLGNGAEDSINIKNKLKQTPYDVAIKYDRPALAILLATDDDSQRKALLKTFVSPFTTTLKEVKRLAKEIKDALPELWGRKGFESTFWE